MADQLPLVRQWMLLRMLSSRRYGATLREMAEDMNVNQKTISRDLQLLARVGFPVSETTGDHGRKHWKLDGTAAPALSFTLTEAASLYLARRFLDPLAGTDFWEGAQSAFRKIRANLGNDALRYLEKIAVAFHQTNTGTGDYSHLADTIDALMVAIEDRRVVHISYRSDRATEAATRDIYPYGIIYHRGSLYLVAFAPEHDQVRHYKIDRIDEVHIEDLQFSRPADFSLRDHLAHTFGIYHGDSPPLRIRVRFLPPVVRYVQEKRWHESQQFTPQRDGSLLAEFELTATEEIKKWLYSFGPNAIVLEPATLRHEIAAELQQTLAHYTDQPTPTPPPPRRSRPR